MGWLRIGLGFRGSSRVALVEGWLVSWLVLSRLALVGYFVSGAEVRVGQLWVGLGLAGVEDFLGLRSWGHPH